MIVTDIEGTTSAIAHVHDVLFPYSRSRIQDWVRRPEAASVVREVAADPDQAASILIGWIDADVKATPLKTLQGLIWAEGYACGELTAHVYDDVPPVLRRWSAQGVPVYVYSSGSELAQRLWFRHTQHGDLLGHFAGHYDTVSAGPKREVGSYQVIAKSIGVDPAELTFLSDVAAELDAAAEAGWHTIGVSRPEDGSPDTGSHPRITTFAEL
ncbi:acireductone synthase [Kutzneria sp. NPDC052558]|uniref:acireductone synthase n=1 Tax=Kutzneria sp. NPDC052558 TaxID=3364121 RepID=UPI0037C9C20D